MAEPLSEVMTIYGPGSCPVCFKALWVADSEISLMELDSNGFPVSEETINRVTAKCPNCGHKQIMMRYKGGYLPYTYTNHMQLLIEEDYETQKRIQALRSIKNGAEIPNPLVISEKITVGDNTK